MDYLETLSYGTLQKWAKKFKIRANQKAAKLRKGLLQYVDDIKLNYLEEIGLPLPSSTPAKLSSRRNICNENADENMCLIKLEKSVHITTRCNNEDMETELSKSFERHSSPFEDSTNENKSTSNENGSAKDSSEDSQKLSEVGEEDKKMNETYSIPADDDSMKENIAPDCPFSPPPRLPDANSSIIVIEEDTAFFVYETADRLELPSAKKSIPQGDNNVTKLSSQACKLADNMRTATYVPHVAESVPPAASSAKKDRKLAGAKSIPRAPNFKLIHQRQFSKMESIGEFQKRRKPIAMKENSGASKTSLLKLPTTLKPSSVALSKKTSKPEGVLKPTATNGALPRGILTSNHANIKPHSNPKSSPTASKRIPMSAYNEKRKHAFHSKSTASLPPSKRIRLEALTASHPAHWKK